MSGERFDVIVLGAGPGSEVAVFRLAPRGLKVALVERELIGGECSYWHPTFAEAHTLAAEQFAR